MRISFRSPYKDFPVRCVSMITDVCFEPLDCVSNTYPVFMYGSFMGSPTVFTIDTLTEEAAEQIIKRLFLNGTLDLFSDYESSITRFWKFDEPTEKDGRWAQSIHFEKLEGV